MMRSAAAAILLALLLVQTSSTTVELDEEDFEIFTESGKPLAHQLPRALSFAVIWS